MFLFFDSLPALYVISGLFGLFQGGIVPSYVIIVREYFPAREAGAKVGIVIAATIDGVQLVVRHCGEDGREASSFPSVPTPLPSGPAS